MMKNHIQLNEETKTFVSSVLRITDIYAHFILVLHRSEVAQVSRPTEQFYKAPLVLWQNASWHLRSRNTEKKIQTLVYRFFFNFLWFYIGLILILYSLWFIFLFKQVFPQIYLKDSFTESQMKIVPLGVPLHSTEHHLRLWLEQIYVFFLWQIFPIDSSPMSLWSLFRYQ